jgi:hypothetical protein
MSSRLYLGTRKGLFSLVQHGGSWQIASRSFLGVQVPMILPDPRDGSVYACVQHGHFGAKLHRSDDRGQTWTEIATPTFPPKPDDAPEIVCPVRKKPIPWSVELLWSLEPGGPDQPGRLWCGTIPGALFRSNDKGASWDLVHSLWNLPQRAKWMGGGYDYPGIHSICVDPRKSTTLGVGISCGGYWISNDDGASWTNHATGMRAAFMPPDQTGDPDIQDPHRIAQCTHQPDHLWCQHHNGVFRSTNSGRSWSEILSVPPSEFGFAVAVHPHHGDTAWFAPATKDECRIPVDGKVVVTRTTDGGQSFEVLRQGLPQQDAYDLIYRHGLAVDHTGRWLALGSTTGTAWISDDAGDHWITLSKHLPPIFCVRWG